MRKTSKLLLLCSPGALDSEPVLHEVEAFQSKNRTIVPIDFGGTLRNHGDRSLALLQKLSPDILLITEPLEQFGIDPSENTLKEIRDGFRITRQQQKRLRWFAGAAFAFAVIAVVAVWQGHEAGLARDAAESEKREALRELSNVDWLLGARARDNDVAFFDLDIFSLEAPRSFRR